MAQYINKDALVAEIDKRLHQLTDAAFDSMIGRNLIEIKDFIDALEVQEDNLLTEKKIEKELAEDYINIFDKKFGDKLPNLKSKQLSEFKNFINTCEQTFHMKYFDYHATQGKLFEKLALLWAVWGKTISLLKSKLKIEI